MTLFIDNPRGIATIPFGKYVCEKCSGELELKLSLLCQDNSIAKLNNAVFFFLTQDKKITFV